MPTELRHPDPFTNINALLACARVRWLDATWRHDLPALEVATVDIDALLEELFTLQVLRAREAALYST